MNQVLPTPMTVDEFLRWSVRQERGRYELEGGRVIEMPSETIGHIRYKGRVFVALLNAIERAGVAHFALSDGATVRIAADRAYEPDALIAPLPGPSEDSLEIANPSVVVEVLSSSTARRDLTSKVAGYALVPSIAHYLVIDPVERLVFHYRRVGALLATPDAPAEGTLHLDPPGLELPVADLLGPEPAG